MGAESHKMTDLEFCELWKLFDRKELNPRQIVAIDDCLKENAYAVNRQGWGALVHWMKTNLKDRA